MYSDGIFCRNCIDCIFYYDVGGLGFYCRSFLPSIPLIARFPSNSVSSFSFDIPCPRYINFMAHLAELRSCFDGVNI